MKHQTIFSVKYLNRRVKNFLTKKTSNRQEIINSIKNGQKNITNTKIGFDTTKADGALGFFEMDENRNIHSIIRAIIELKDARTPLDKAQNSKDFKGSPVEQAFMYTHKIGTVPAASG